MTKKERSSKARSTSNITKSLNPPSILLEGGKKPSRPHWAHRGLQKTLRPSKEALELAGYLGRDLAWLEGLKEGGKQFKFKFLGPSLDELRAIAESIRNPAKRLDVQSAVRKAARDVQFGEAKRLHRKLRVQAEDWHEQVVLYSRHRPRILALPEEDRPRAVRELIAARLKENPSHLQELEDALAKHKGVRQAEISAKRSAQYKAWQLKSAGLRSGPRKPMKRMLFPRSATNNERDMRRFYEKAKRRYEIAFKLQPELLELSEKERAEIVLSDSWLVRPDDEMWHSRKAVATDSNYDQEKERE